METGGLLMVVDFNTSKGVNLARWRVKVGEYLFIADGFALVTWRGVFVIDGYVRIEGILQVQS